MSFDFTFNRIKSEPIKLSFILSVIQFLSAYNIFIILKRLKKKNV